MVKLAVLRDHLRLKPETEPHADGFAGFDNGGESIRQLPFVCKPVAKRSSVVVSVSEPSVVENKNFNTQILAASDQIEKLLIIEIKICCLPVVNDNGTAFSDRFGVSQMRADQIVILLGKAV